jgi:hypothetical protein
MLGLGRAFEALQDEAGRFVLERERRLLDVVTSPRLRRAVLDLVMAQEHRASNRSPFVLFEQPFAARKPGWLERSEHARQQHEHRREQMEGVGEQLEPLPGPARENDPLTRFALQLGQLLQVRPAGTVGLVVVLAPSPLEAGPAWSDAMRRLLQAKGLQEVRWVVVDLDEGSVGDVLSSLGSRGKQVDCVPDARDEQQLLKGLIASLASGREGPPGARPAVEPPLRRDRPAPASPDPELGRRRLVTSEVLSSMLALAARQPTQAVEHQRRARDLSAAPGPSAEAVTMELVLGAQLVAAGQPRLAEQSYARVVETAEAAKLPEQAATGHLALGTTRWVQRNQHGALVAYAEGVVVAERGGATMLAIEGCRLTGQVAMSLGMDAQAIAFWGRAVRLAEGSSESPSLGCASICARNLAELCERRGLHAQAVQMREKAEALAAAVSVRAPVEEREVPAMPPAEEKLEVPAHTPPPPPPSPVEVLPPQPPVEEPLPGPESEPELVPVPEPVLVEEPGPVPEVTIRWEPEPFLPPASSDMPSTQRLVLPAARVPVPSPPKKGTDLFTLQDVAALHWGGANVERSTEIPRWTDAQQDSLRKATLEVLDETTTSLLDPQEMAALQGEAPLWRPLEQPMVEHTVPVSNDGAASQGPKPSVVEGTDALTLDQIARLRSLRRGPGGRGDGEAGE